MIGTGVTVNSLHPGRVITEIARDTSIVHHKFVQMLLRPLAWFIIKDATQGAQTTICCAVSPEFENVTGKYFRYEIYQYPAILILLQHHLKEKYTQFHPTVKMKD